MNPSLKEGKPSTPDMEDSKRQRLQYLLETAHIPLWLIKDICWLMSYRLAGVIIAVPTIAVAIWMALLTRRNKDQFLPNVSIAFWILANANWMFAEFYELPTKELSIYPFALGVLVFLIFVLKRMMSGKDVPRAK